MAMSRKYAALPDLDSAPDTYETPSLTDDNSTAPHGTTERSGSASSNYSDSDFGTAASGASPPGSPQISRSKLHPDAARALFEPARIDAEGVDFSERVGGKKRSYRASSRRVRGEFGAEDSDGEEEGLERRVARLRREIEECKEMAKREKESNNGDEENGEVKGLSRLLDELEIDEFATSASAARLQSSLATPLPANTPTIQTPPVSAEGGQAAAHTSSYNPTHTLALTTSFDSRLSALESALGLPSISLATTPPPPMLPTLDNLAKKLAMLTTMTPAQLDALSRRVRALTTETEKLGAAKAAARRGQTTSESTATTDSDDSGAVEKTAEKGKDHDEDLLAQVQESKINALFGTLSTIERLAPLLPGVLERLRSLRVVHAGAAERNGEIEEAMARQVEMGREIARWAEGLEKVEGAVREGERVGGENVKAVEGWVRELEARLGKLEV